MENFKLNLINKDNKRIDFVWYCTLTLSEVVTDKLVMLKDQLDDKLKEENLFSKNIKHWSNDAEKEIVALSNLHKSIKNRYNQKYPQFKVYYIDKDMFFNTFNDKCRLERITKLCWGHHMTAMSYLYNEFTILYQILKDIMPKVMASNQTTFLYAQSMCHVQLSIRKLFQEVTKHIEPTDIKDFSKEDSLDFFLDCLKWVAEGGRGEIVTKVNAK